MKTIVLVPAYNAEATIGRVIKKAKDYCDKVIVFDDGSNDMTGVFAEIFGARTIIGHKNLGKGFALKKLFWEVNDAMEDDIIVTIDADGQHNPDDIPKLIEPIKKGEADYVVGTRKKMLWWRNGANWFADKLLRNKETQSGFRAYNGKAVWGIHITQSGFGVDAEILNCLKNMRRVDVPIDIKYDKYSHTKDVVTHFLEVLSYALTSNPLAYLCFPGIIGFIIAIVGFVRVSEAWRIYEELALGTMIFSMTLLLVSVVTFFTGVILHVLRGETVNRRGNP